MFVFFLQTLLKELEEFAHKGIPDVRGCKVQDAMLLEEMVGILLIYQPHCEKTGLWGFGPGPTQTGLYSHIRWLEACSFIFRKKRDCAIRVAKTKALISCTVTAQLICVFVFAYVKSRFSHDAAHSKFSNLFKYCHFSWL